MPDIASETISEWRWIASCRTTLVWNTAFSTSLRTA